MTYQEITSIDELRAAAKDARRALGYSQQEVANLTGRTQKWLSDFESGKTDPPLSMAISHLMSLGLKITLTSRSNPSAGGENEHEIEDGI